MMVVNMYNLLAVVLLGNVLGVNTNDDIKSLIQTVWEDMAKKFEELQSKLETMEGQLKDCQQCTKNVQVDAVPGSSASEQQEFLRSIQEKCSKDLLGDVLDLLETDECLEGNHTCSEMATCTDTITHYKCKCLPGYVGDGRTCEDIDECVSGDLNDCHDHADCINTIGSYDCQCRSDYVGNGTVCELDCRKPYTQIPEVGCVYNPYVSGTWYEGKLICELSHTNLFVATTTEQVFALKRYYEENPPPGTSKDIWVGLKNGIWLNGRVPEINEWEAGRPAGGWGPCGHIAAYISGFYTPSYLLRDHRCNGDAYPLCQKFGPPITSEYNHF